MENILAMDDSDQEGRDKEGNVLNKEQLRSMENNAIKGTKKDKKRKRMENDGRKLETDSDVNSEDIDADSEGDEDNMAKKKGAKTEEPDKEHKPMRKTVDEIKKGQFLGEKYGHFKIGTYV